VPEGAYGEFWAGAYSTVSSFVPSIRFSLVTAIVAVEVFPLPAVSPAEVTKYPPGDTRNTNPVGEPLVPLPVTVALMVVSVVALVAVWLAVAEVVVDAPL
jgi:hypothetical protein